MTKFLALISGKGGAGKTTSALNLAHALTKLGKKTLLLDASFATPDLAPYLGLLHPKATLNDFLRKEKTLPETIHLHHSGLSFIPSSPSYLDFKKTRPDQLTEAFEHLENLADFILVDCPAGLGYDLVQVLKNTDEAIIITNPNLPSVINALKAIEIARENHNSLPGFVLNLTAKARHELKPSEVEQLLSLPLLANIPYDKKIKKSVHRQSPVHYLYPRAKSSRQYLKLAEFLTHRK